ncbi:hypothetical protein [Shewanella gaetbuli]|uniref:Uncharacterized protein n=1 Tax=Shewanella gaetbuli TaxID=220752 RepID=A0A9X2CGM6_9GAMM|nr:hypothetical protein [Shewanella gaetbuli]MCL1142548.1 hypothetical protein [Shewanella gaetbuli]
MKKVKLMFWRWVFTVSGIFALAVLLLISPFIKRQLQPLLFQSEYFDYEYLQSRINAPFFVVHNDVKKRFSREPFRSFHQIKWWVFNHSDVIEAEITESGMTFSIIVSKQSFVYSTCVEYLSLCQKETDAIYRELLNGSVLKINGQTIFYDAKLGGYFSIPLDYDSYIAYQ